MYTNVNLAAPVGALALLGTGFILVVVGVVFLHALIAKRSARAKFVLGAMVVIAAGYLALMVILSLASSEAVLARGEEKHFCEIDCHLAYSIVAVNQAKTLGAPSNQATANGTFYVITIKTRFDENTISRNRGDGLLYPNSRVLTVIDDEGRKFAPSPEGERALDQIKGSGTALTTPLRPSESYTSTVVFDLPANIGKPTLLINEGEWLTHFVIGHENSPLHKKTKFQI